MGADGAGGHSAYKQDMEGSEVTAPNDKSVFAATMSILALKVNGIFVWINPCPNGIRFNRPIFFSFEKETKELILNVVKGIECQMTALRSQPLKYT